MTHPSSPPAPMTAERLEEIRDEVNQGSHKGVPELFEHIAALTARVATLESELAAARKVEDGEVARLLQCLEFQCARYKNDAKQCPSDCPHWPGGADVVRRLSAALKEAERQVVDWTVRTGRQVERADAAEAKLETVRVALEPFAKLGGPDPTMVRAFPELPEDTVIFKNSGACFTAGDVRRARVALGVTRALQTKDTTP